MPDTEVYIRNSLTVWQFFMEENPYVYSVIEITETVSA